MKDKLNVFEYSQLEWTEPKQGEQFVICSSGGGARALIAFWAIMKRHGKRIFKQASMIATNSGSSWFINQLLYSKEDFFDSKTGGGLKSQVQHNFEKRVADIYEVNPNYTLR